MYHGRSRMRSNGHARLAHNQQDVMRIAAADCDNDTKELQRSTILDY